MNQYRTHTCGELREADVNKTVTLAGWIHRKRNLGNLCFVDLRDHYGITQCVVDSSSDLFDKLNDIRVESVIGVTGKVLHSYQESCRAQARRRGCTKTGFL